MDKGWIIGQGIFCCLYALFFWISYARGPQEVTLTKRKARTPYGLNLPIALFFTALAAMQLCELWSLQLTVLFGPVLAVIVIFSLYYTRSRIPALLWQHLFRAVCVIGFFICGILVLPLLASIPQLANMKSTLFGVALAFIFLSPVWAVMLMRFLGHKDRKQVAKGDEPTSTERL